MSLYSVIATCFGVGKFRYAPGSMGSLTALPLAWWLSTSYGSQILISVSIILFIIGIWASEAYANNIGQADPGSIVIDELTGQLFTLGFVTVDLWTLAAGFVLFRFFDIAKPWPIYWIDKKLKGGFGIMLDDIIAAIFAIPMLYLFEIFILPWR
jgi:phosphatidylglycerophosphatase A